MKYFFLALISLVTSLVSGQIFEPVVISTTYEFVDDETLRLSVDCKIEDGWNIYALKLESNDGPIASSLVVNKNTAFTSIGEAKESKYKTKDDAVFGMKVNYHKGEATFYQDVKLKDVKALKITGNFEYMACNNERCLPPELIEVSWDIKAPSKNNAKKIDLGTVATVGNINAQAETATDDADDDGIFEPVVWRFSFSELKNGVQTLTATATIDEGWHVYATELESEDGPVATSFNLKNEATALSKLRVPKPIEAYDPNYQLNLAFYENEATFTWDIKPDADGKIKGVVEFMVCNEERCLPPELIDFANYDLQKTAVSTSSNIDEALVIDGLDKDNPLKDCNISSAVSNEKKSNWGIFVLGFLGGLLALLTPCVFPMIPLTVSFFTKGGSSKGGKWQSVLYGAFIVIIYLLLSTPFYFLDSINPEILNTISTNVYLNVFFFVIFVVFAISFFGYFELTVPARFTNKIDSASEIGGIVGIFFMALTLSLVSFSCTGPILGSLLAGSLSADGGAVQLSAGMGGFGLALALPFALFAAFPGVMKKLPKSGSWLNTVKVVLGFVELALAIKFLSKADLVDHWGLLKREIFFGAWIVIGIGLVLYLFAKIRFPHDSPITKLKPGRIIFGLLTLSFVIYLLPGLSNTEYANRRLLSGFPPPLFYSIYEKDSECPLGLECYKDFNEGLKVAQETGKPILLDFTGWACENCRKMEENVWVDERVFEVLNNDVVLISLYVDDRKELPEEDQFEYVNPKGTVKQIKTVGNKWATFQTVNFINNSQPFYALISPDGQLLTPPVGYTPKAAEYLRFLECGIDAYKADGN